MKVRELIEILSNYDWDREVKMAVNDNHHCDKPVVDVFDQKYEEGHAVILTGE